MSKLRKVFAALLFVISISLAIAALKGFYSLLIDVNSNGLWALGLASPGVVPVKAPAPNVFGPALTRSVEVQDYSDEERRTRVLVTLTAYKLLVTNSTLAGDLKVKVPVSLKAAFEPQLSKIIGCPKDRSAPNNQPNVEENYADKNLLIRSLNEIGPSRLEVPIPLDDFLKSSIASSSETCREQREDIINRPAEFLVSTHLPVLPGPAEQYPSDYHQVSASFEIQLPPGFTLSGATQDEVSGTGSSPATLPLAIRLRSSRGMEGRTIAVFRPVPSLPLPRSIDQPRITSRNVNTTSSQTDAQIYAPPQDDVEDLRLAIVRDWETQSFYYAVALLPLVLLLLVTMSLFSGAASSITEQTLNLAGFTLAISALRTILVPSDVQGLTRIDSMLVIQLLAITSSIAFLNGRHVWVSASRNNPVDEDRRDITPLSLAPMPQALRRAYSAARSGVGCSAADREEAMERDDGELREENERITTMAEELRKAVLVRDRLEDLARLMGSYPEGHDMRARLEGLHVDRALEGVDEDIRVLTEALQHPRGT